MKKFYKSVLFLPLLFCLAGSFVQAAEGKAPAKLQAAIIVKLLPMYNNLAGKEYTIHVIDAPDVAQELQGMVGKTTGKGVLKNVTSSAGVPSGGAEIVYIGGNASAGIDYSTKNSVLSITGDLNTAKSGATLCIGLENAKPKIYLNLTSSKAVGADWNPAILKLAQTIK